MLERIGVHAAAILLSAMMVSITVIGGATQASVQGLKLPELLRCEAAGQPPSDNWLSDEAQCIGEAPLIETEVEWWKMPAKPDPATTWHWFTKQDRLPWRSLFASPSDALAMLGRSDEAEAACREALRRDPDNQGD